MIKLILLVLPLLSLSAFSHESLKPAACKGIFGLKQINELNNQDKAVLTYKKTPLYKGFSDEDYFTFVSIDKKLAKKTNPRLQVRIFNNQNSTLKSSLTEKLTKSPISSSELIFSTNVWDYLYNELNEKFDEYYNKNKAEKKSIDKTNIPYSAYISVISKDGVKLCGYEIEYASKYLTTGH